MKNILFLIISIITACSQAKPSSSKLDRAPSIDIARLKGDWTIAARIPTIIDRQASDMKASIELSEDHRLAIKWKFKKSQSADTQTEWNLTATPGVLSESTIWKISPIWPLKFTFQITEFSGDYSWIVIASSDRKYLWILSRNNEIDPGLLDALMDRLAKSEFDIGAILRQTVKKNEFLQ